MVNAVNGNTSTVHTTQSIEIKESSTDKLQPTPVNQSGSNNNQRPYPRIERRHGMVIVTLDPNNTWKPPTQAGIDQKVKNEIARVENLQEYKDHPIEYVKSWIARRGGTEEYRIPEDGALLHFQKLYNLEIKK